MKRFYYPATPALLFCLLCTLSPIFNSHAQIRVFGKVTDTKGEPLIGVNISVVNTYDGATTKATGEYQFKTDQADTLLLKASYTGFITQEIKKSGMNTELQVDFVLKEKISDLKAVVISAGAFEASDEKKGTVLKPLDIVTTAGSNGDNFGALKTLPGTQQTNDREGLFVRGGTGAETQTFIDGTWVKNAFSAAIPDLGARGRFNPFIFKGTVFSAGGYSALYGQALSSAVILETIDLPERSSANFNLSSVGIGSSIQWLSPKKNQSLGIGYNYLNLSPYFALIKQNIDFSTAPTGHQVDLNYRLKTSANGILKFYGYLNHTRIRIGRDFVDSHDFLDPNKVYTAQYAVNNTNVYGNLSYKHYWKSGWKLQAGLSASHNVDDIETRIFNQSQQLVQDSVFLFQNWLQIDNRNQLATGKIVLERNWNNLNAFRGGVEHMINRDENQVRWHPGTQEQLDFRIPFPLKDQYTALFAESDIYITNDLAGKIGIRGEYSGLLDQFNIAPRASAAYKLKRAGQFSAAWGMFYQKPENIYLFQQQDLDYMRADHYIINYQYQPKDRLLRLEAYHKTYHHLMKTQPILANAGSGYARGIELFYRDKKSIKGIDFWVSYSWIDSKRDFLNYPAQVQPDFVANHVASLVFKKFWEKRMFGINGTYTFSSGRPYYNPNTSLNPVQPDLFMSDRTPAYHNVSFSLNYLRTIYKAFTVFVLSVSNPFNFKQVYGYNYSSADWNADGRFAGREITPTARQFIFLGMFMSWGIDRTQEAIDGNL